VHHGRSSPCNVATRPCTLQCFLLLWLMLALYIYIRHMQCLYLWCHILYLLVLAVIYMMSYFILMVLYFVNIMVHVYIYGVICYICWFWRLYMH